jgi:hypothetical protein
MPYGMKKTPSNPKPSQNSEAGYNGNLNDGKSNMPNCQRMAETGAAIGSVAAEAPTGSGTANEKAHDTSATVI